MKLYIVRHGETLFNFLERVQGWSDSPLTPKGEEQGKAVGKHLAQYDFDAIFSSDLKRATDTANYILEHQSAENNIQTTPLLREAYFGGFEGGSETGPWGPIYKKYGYPVEEIETNYDESMKKVMTHVSNEESRDMIAENDELNLAENFEQFQNRVNTFVEKISNMQEVEKVAIVCHGGTARLILEILLGTSEKIIEVDNCSTSIIEVKNEGNKLIKFNDTSYL